MISLNEFRALNLEAQLEIVFLRGVYLASRYEGEAAVNLYWMNTFFAEVFYAQETNELVQCRGFTSAGPLGKYADAVQLPKL